MNEYRWKIKCSNCSYIFYKGEQKPYLDSYDGHWVYGRFEEGYKINAD